MKQFIYIITLILSVAVLQATENINRGSDSENIASAVDAMSHADSSEPFNVDKYFGTTSTGDVLALTPWELLGEDDGLSDNFDAMESLQSDLVDYASKFIGTRYRHGAKGPKAFDCSGFTSYVFKNFGMTLSPSSRTQGTQGRKVGKDEVMVGDLMFFSGRRGGNTIGHVGMVVDVDQATGKIKFIHAATSQGVVIQSFPDNGYYSQRFLQFRRVLDDEKVLPLEARTKSDDNRLSPVL